MTRFQKYVVMRDNGAYEGWRLVMQTDSILEAAQARDDNMRDGGGGEVQIFEWIHPFKAYDQAGYEQIRREREEKEKKAAT